MSAKHLPCLKLFVYRRFRAVRGVCEVKLQNLSKALQLSEIFSIFAGRFIHTKVMPKIFEYFGLFFSDHRG